MMSEATVEEIRRDAARWVPVARELTFDSWITSDNHWGGWAGGWDVQPTREDQMRHGWCGLVEDDDLILHLGDLADSADADWLDGLPGRKFLILGNLDRGDEAWYREAGFEVVGRGTRPFYWKAPGGELVAFSHEPLGRRGEPMWPFDVNIHGHIHDGPLWDEQYEPGKKRVNVSVHVTDFAPIRLGEALERES